MRWALAWFCVGCVPSAWDYDAFPIPEHFPAPETDDTAPVNRNIVEYGRHLFHDFRLSFNGTRSCGVCHEAKKGWTDGFVRSVGATNEVASHNSLSVANVLWREKLTWADPGLERLEDQLQIPWFGHDPIELGMAGQEELLIERLESTDFYPGLHEAAFGDAPMGFATATRALVAYQKVIIGGDSPYDRYLQGETSALSPEQIRGHDLFFSDQLGCGQCHGGVFLDQPTTNGSARHGYANTGMYNIDGEGGYPPAARGLIETTGNPDDEGAFRIPSLRNVAQTGPWLHDGTVLDLGDLVDAYARGGRNVESGAFVGDGATNPHKSALITGFSMTAEERASILAFLDSLTEPSMIEPGDALRSPFCETDPDGQIVNAPCLPRFEAD